VPKSGTRSRATRLLRAVGLCFALSACATAPRSAGRPGETAAPAPQAGGDIVRDDWLAAPTRTGGREVITRKDYLEQRARRARPKLPNREQVPAPLLNATPELSLKVGQVRSFMLVDEPVRRMHSSGGSAGVFWTTPYYLDRLEKGHLVEHKGADVLLQGLSPGKTELTLELTDGSSRTYELEVRESVASRPGT